MQLVTIIAKRGKAPDMTTSNRIAGRRSALDSDLAPALARASAQLATRPAKLGQPHLGDVR